MNNTSSCCYSRSWHVLNAVADIFLTRRHVSQCGDKRQSTILWYCPYSFLLAEMIHTGRETLSSIRREFLYKYKASTSHLQKEAHVGLHTKVIGPSLRIQFFLFLFFIFILFSFYFIFSTFIQYITVVIYARTALYKHHKSTYAFLLLMNHFN